MTVQEDRDQLLSDVKMGLSTVNVSAIKYRRFHTTLAFCTIVSGLFATLLAGDSARNGKVLAGNTAKLATGKAPSDLPKGWRIVCGVIAVCTLLSTAAASIDKLLKIAEHRSKAITCAGAVDSLRVTLESTARPTRETIDDSRAEYAKLRSDYAEYFR